MSDKPSLEGEFNEKTDNGDFTKDRDLCAGFISTWLREKDKQHAIDILKGKQDTIQDILQGYATGNKRDGWVVEEWAFKAEISRLNKELKAIQESKGDKL